MDKNSKLNVIGAYVYKFYIRIYRNKCHYYIINYVPFQLDHRYQIIINLQFSS